MKIFFKWLCSQTDDNKTKNFLKKLQANSVKYENKLINIRQKFPIKLGRWKLWLNKENIIYSLNIYSEIFREKHHGKMNGFPSKKDSVIVDLGANEGFYVLKAKEIAPNSKIIAVEPNPTAFRVLKKNVKINRLKNVITLNKAVTSKNGKIKFEIVKGRSEVGSVKVYEKYRKNLKKIKIDSITLENLCRRYKIDKIDFLKIDVEGSEVDILKSSKRVLPRVKKAIIEYHNAQKTINGVKKIMARNNFKLVKVDDQKFYGDLYFIRKV